MYIKDKERVFKCIPLYSMYCFPGNSIEFTSTWKQISYNKNNFTQCINIINEGFSKCMIMYDRIPRLLRPISFVRRHF